MTTQKNAFADAISNIAASRDLSATNKKRASALALLARREEISSMLKAANVKTARLDKRALYATEKVVKFLSAVTQDVCSADDFNENAFATFKTVLLCEDAKQRVTFADLQAALSKDVKVSSERAALVYRRNTILSAQTLSAQSQQCRDMLKTLNVVREVAKNTFEINSDNAVLIAAREKLADLTL